MCALFNAVCALCNAVCALCDAPSVEAVVCFRKPVSASEVTGLLLRGGECVVICSYLPIFSCTVLLFLARFLFT